MSKPFRLPPVTEIVVACPPGQTLAAELRGGDVWGLHWHWDDQPSMLGAVHSIRVTRLAPEANGVFAVADEAGTEAFLDLSNTKIFLHEGERLLAQVTRVAEGGKRLTFRPDVRLAGRHLVYTPGRPGLAVSRQIRDKAASQRLQGLLRSHAQAGEGIIVRAAAASLGDRTGPILDELAQHRQSWQAAQQASSLGPCLPAPSLIDNLLIERAGAGPAAIITDSPAAFSSLQQAAARLAPGEPIHIEQERGNPFATSGAAEALAEAFQAEVPLSGGGRLWIEQTRACWTVDVDSSNASPGKAPGLRLALNRTAAVEIARQARLRGMAGSIIADFLRLQDAKAEHAVLQDLRAAFAEDPAALRFNERFDPLGFYAFSRQRLGPGIAGMRADGGKRLAILTGLDQLVRQSLASPSQRFALAISPAASGLLAEMPKAIAETQRRTGQPPAVTTEPTLAPDAFDVRPIPA